MDQQVAVKPWGNSQGIRIPKNILEKLNINHQLKTKLKFLIKDL